MEACDEFSCGVPSSLLTVTSDQLITHKTITKSNVSTIIPETGKPLWDASSANSTPKDATIGFMVYACVFTVFAASLFTSLFAFWLINRFSSRDRQTILTQTRQPVSSNHQISDNYYYMPNNTPYQLAIQRKM